MIAHGAKATELSPLSAASGAAEAGTTSRREVRGWQLYGLANAAFVTTVAGVLGGPYLTSLAEDRVGKHGQVAVGPIHVATGSWVPYLSAVCTAVQVLLLPAVTARGDRGARRSLLALTTAIGATLTVLLLAIPRSDYRLAALDYGAALITFGLAQAIYNGMLNDVAAPADRDAVSARAYALSYAGGGGLLLVNLVIVLGHSGLGLSKGQAVQVCLASAGLWWGLFGARAISTQRRGTRSSGQFRTVEQLRAVRRALADLPGTRRFLIAYLFFNDAVQTAIGVASIVITHTIFGGDTDKAAGFLLVLFLVIQLVAAPGALLAGRLAARYGAQRVLETFLVAWIAIVLASYLLLTSKAATLAIGLVIAVVLGGSGSLTRSIYSRLIPAGQESLFFGVYQLAERGTAWVALVLFGAVYQVTGSYRGAILSLAVVFAVGLILLRTCDTEAAATQASAAAGASQEH